MFYGKITKIPELVKNNKLFSVHPTKRRISTFILFGFAESAQKLNFNLSEEKQSSREINDTGKQ